jgi:AraC-like DNA-binding protein
VDARERRLAENEALFRDINERVQEVAAAHGFDDHRYSFFCECSNADCTLQLELTGAEYESVRSHPSRFVVAPGHELPEIEHVVEVRQAWTIVEKEGGGAEIAVARDPRVDG